MGSYRVREDLLEEVMLKLGLQGKVGAREVREEGHCRQRQLGKGRES